MFKEHRLSQLIISVFFIILFNSCSSNYKGKFEVIRYHKSDYKWPCCLKIENGKYFVIDNIRRYDDGLLVEYEGCASEGKFVKDFLKANKYNEEDEKMKKLFIYKTSDKIVFFEKSYHIVEKVLDSVFVKSENEDDYYVFIGNIPLEKQ